MDKKENQSIFTESTIANFFILIILVLPGILVFIATKELVSSLWLSQLPIFADLPGSLWLSQLPIFTGLLGLLIFFPITLRVVNKINTSVKRGD